MSSTTFEATAPPAESQRLLSLDVLRGITVAGMILVTDPGTYTFVYPQLRHALWNNPTAADLIFPCFLFMVGLSLTLSFASRLQRGVSRASLAWRALRRSLLLVAIGLVLNGFPHYDFAHLRIPGILQRIGLCYLLVSGLYLVLQRPEVSSRARQLCLVAVAFGTLALYWLLLRFYPTPGFGPGHLDPLGTLPAVLDRAVFTVPHLFQWGVQTTGYGITFDPEGILSTLGALATVLVGMLAGEVLRNNQPRARQAGVLATTGTLLWLTSLALRPLMPLNKQIYTPTFALWSSGLSLLAFAGFFSLIDIGRVHRGWTLARIYGTNAIFAFALSQVVTNLLQLAHVSTAHGPQDLHGWLHATLFAPWLPPYVASLAYAIAIVLLDAALVYPLYRRRIFLRL